MIKKCNYAVPDDPNRRCILPANHWDIVRTNHFAGLDIIVNPGLENEIRYSEERAKVMVSDMRKRYPEPYRIMAELVTTPISLDEGIGILAHTLEQLGIERSVIEYVIVIFVYRRSLPVLKQQTRAIIMRSTAHLN